MSKLPTRSRRRNGRPQPLPLLDLIERRRWEDASRAARWVGRRCGVTSPSAARLIAELANLRGDK
jgi:hypothetical protein